MVASALHFVSFVKSFPTSDKKTKRKLLLLLLLPMVVVGWMTFHYVGAVARRANMAPSGCRFWHIIILCIERAGVFECVC